jgi:hypothetical protein
MTKDEVREALAQLDERFDADVNLPCRIAATPGYHTSIADGARVHEIRESADYAILCLRSDEAQRIARGQAVLRQLLSLQDADPLSPTFGIWSWFYEEPLSKMNPPDWNWADFIGARLLMVLSESASKLDAALLGLLSEAIERAAMCIFRRHSPVSYTNIAIMGAGVCAAAGEQLGRPVLLEYGRDKLGAVLKLAQEVGCFSEYNSPTYTMVAIEECERILMLVRDGEVRKVARELHAAAWKMVAEHWHQPTEQWAGPHGRAYSDRLTPATLRRIGAAIGRELTTERAGSSDELDLVLALPCPTSLLELFAVPLQTPRTVTTPLGAQVDGEAKVATTWLAPTCCLSSVTREHTWTQRRNILAYWRAAGEVAMFKVQWLMDGRDMAGMRLVSRQVENRILLGLYPLYNCGAWHPYFVVPPDHTHTLGDLRLRFLLEGPDPRACQRSASSFELGCGDHCVRIDLVGGEFDGTAVQWRLTQEGGRAMLDGICVEEGKGAPQRINFQTLKIRLGAALQLLRPGDAAMEASLSLRDGGDGRVLEWPGSGLPAVVVPAEARPFSF